MMIHRCLVFVLLATNVSLIAQTPPAIEWERCFGGTNIETGNAIRQTSDGGYLIAGSTYSTDGDVTLNQGNADVWVIKVDAFGDLIWQRTYGGSNAEHASAIAITSDGGSIIAAHTQSNNGDVTGNHGAQDYWILKLDGSGDLEWQKALGGSGGDIANAIAQTSDGGYVVAGYSLSLDGDAQGIYYNANYWVVKLDVQGVIQWSRNYGGNWSDFAFSIQQTADGGYIVGGYTDSTDGDVIGNHGGHDQWILKLDPSGDIQWKRTFGGTGDDFVGEILQTNDGGYIVVGGSGSSDGDATFNNGLSDFWIVKLNEAGYIQWQTSLGGSGYDRAQAVHQTSDGSYVIIGRSNSSNGDVTGGHGHYDFWVVKVDEEGTLLWQLSLGGSAEEWGSDIRQTIDGGYILVGNTKSSNDDVSFNHGNSDVWVVKLFPDDIGTSAKDPDGVSTRLAYMNPVVDVLQLRLNLETSGRVRVDLYNAIHQPVIDPIERMMGKDVHTLSIPMEHLPAGIYYLNLKTEGKCSSHKIIKL